MNKNEILKELESLETIVSEAEGEDKAFLEGEIAAYRIVLSI